jgi:hypothetical protein
VNAHLQPVLTYPLPEQRELFLGKVIELAVVETVGQYGFLEIYQSMTMETKVGHQPPSSEGRAQ